MDLGAVEAEIYSRMMVSTLKIIVELKHARLIRKSSERASHWRLVHIGTSQADQVAVQS